MSDNKRAQFKVKGGTDVKSLGSAIARELQHTSEVVVRAIGVQAVNQASKGIAIAGGFAGQNGRAVITRIGFQTVESEQDSKKKVTALEFRCRLDS